MIDPGEFFKSIPLFHDSNGKLIGMFELGWAWGNDPERAFKCMVLGKDTEGDYYVTAPSLIDYDAMDYYDPTEFMRNFSVDNPFEEKGPAAPPDNMPVWAGISENQVLAKTHLYYSTGKLDEYGQLICYGRGRPKQFSNGATYKVKYWKVAEPNK